MFSCRVYSIVDANRCKRGEFDLTLDIVETVFEGRITRNRFIYKDSKRKMKGTGQMFAFEFRQLVQQIYIIVRVLVSDARFISEL